FIFLSFFVMLRFVFFFFFFFFQAEDGIRDKLVTGVQTCALPISQPALPKARLRLCRQAAGQSAEHSKAAPTRAAMRGRAQYPPVVDRRWPSALVRQRYRSRTFRVRPGR